MRILVADDDEIHRRLLSAAIAREGHETAEAVDGVDALEKLCSGGFDAVISDVLMPRMDGYRLGYEVRRSKDLEKTRIIVYSRTYASLADERMALRAGADRFIRNPVETETILRALRDATRPRRHRKLTVPPAAELATVREYSEVLVGRLETANLKLEASRKRLARANEEISESEERVRLLLDSTAEGIYGLDLDGNFTFCNAAGLAMLGYASPRELLGRNAHTLIRHTRADGEAYPMDESGVFLAIRENRGSHAEDEIFWRADGTSFSAESWSYPVRKDGALVGTVVTFLDITERKRAQEGALLTTGALQSAIFNSANFSSIATDAKGVIQIFNVGAERMLGYTAADVMNKITPAEISDPQEVIARATALSLEFATPIAPGFEALVFKASRGIEDIYELTYIRKDGSRFPAVVSVTALRDAQNAIIGYLLIGTDNTARKRVEEERKRAEQVLAERSTQLEAANKELEAFAYSVSHDLRAPLRAIDGFSQVLLEDHGERLGDSGRDALVRVRAGAGRMSRLIDDLLKLSRVTRADLQRARVDMSETARRVVAELARSEPDRHVDTRIADGVIVEGDQALLQLVLENLLGNAFKFSSKRPEARVEFGVERQNGGPVYYVLDNGAGFDMAYADKLFGAFQRLHSEAEFPGTGIGLATVQRIIHRHGGRVWAEGTVDGGATFRFTL